MKLELDPDIEEDWIFYRVCMHERTRATPAEIETLWSFDDLEKYNRLLDSLDSAQAAAMER